MLRLVTNILQTTPVQWEFKQAVVSYLEEFNWEDRQHGLTFKQKRRSLRRIYVLAKAIHARDWERLAMIREGFQIKYQALKHHRRDIRRDYVRALRLLRGRNSPRYLLRMLRA